MKPIHTILAGTALAVALGAGALAQSHNHQHGAADAAQAGANESASTREFNEVHAKMMRDMQQRFTGQADVDFVRGMIPHHQGAIEMAKVQLRYGKDPEIRKLAEKIIADQEREIAEMQDWLKRNGK